MQIIAGGRGSGKTTRLIRMSAENDIPILVATKVHADYIKDLAKRMNINIREPIVISQCRYISYKNVYIDDANQILRYLIRQALRTDIFAITMTTGDDNNV